MKLFGDVRGQLLRHGQYDSGGTASMRKRRTGMIVNLTSVGGLVGFEAVGHYCATKFAVEGLSESLRAEVAPLGIGVMTVQPSAFRTQWAGSSGAAQTVAEDYQQPPALRCAHTSNLLAIKLATQPRRQRQSTPRLPAQRRRRACCWAMKPMRQRRRSLPPWAASSAHGNLPPVARTS